MAILVTGVGYIGATLLRRLAVAASDDSRGRVASGFSSPLDSRAVPLGPPSHPGIVALDNFFCTSRAQVEAALPPGVQFIEGDVADAKDVAAAFEAVAVNRDDHEPLLVFHLAAQPSAAIAASDPETTERTNLVGALRLVLEAARAHNATVVFGGSFRVYGDALAGQVIDEDAPYGRVGDLSHLSKIYVEQLARTIDLPFISVRLGVAYGCSPIMKQTPAFMTVPNLFCQRAVDGQALQVHQDRAVAFVHVEDAVSSLLAAATALPRSHDAPGAAAGTSQVAINAAPEVMTIGELARTVRCQAARRGLSALIEEPQAPVEPSARPTATVEAQPNRPSDAAPAFTVRSRLDSLAPGFARHSLAQNLGEVLDYFRATRSTR